MKKSEIRSGLIPSSANKTYEELECLLRSYRETLRPLEESPNEDDQKDFARILDIINRLAKRHRIQTPEEAIENPRQRDHRSNVARGNPFEFQSDLIKRIDSFSTDYAIGREAGTVDYKDLGLLLHEILTMLARRGVLSVRTIVRDNRSIAVGVNSWHGEEKTKRFCELPPPA